jgi:hypothetical protein
MKDMPTDEEGNHLHIYNTTDRQGKSKEVVAQLFVKEWGGVGSTVTEAEAPLVQEIEEEVQQKQIQPTKVVTQTVNSGVIKQKVVVPEPEDELMLD